jgi:hypothetical protein
MSYAPGAPPLTADEVDEVAASVAASLFDPGTAAIVAAQLARVMKAEATREQQDRAGARILQTFASCAT